VIEAAGGLLWRRSRTGAVEVALVHRPRYGDWSIPKGKLQPREPVVLAALREVREETGFSAVPGRPLGEIRYLKDGEPKRVRYWAMSAGGGEFTPGSEVDELRWLPADEATGVLPADRDAGILAGLLADPVQTRACVLVRHASAGKRGSWAGPDGQRPLDPAGAAQAVALGPILAAYAPRSILSSGAVRCLQTVDPLSRLTGLAVTTEPLFSEDGYAADPAAAVKRFTSFTAGRHPSVACSQGKAMPDFIAGVCEAFGRPAPPDRFTEKGGYWVFHVSASTPARLLAVERGGAPPARWLDPAAARSRQEPGQPVVPGEDHPLPQRPRADD
jgi:8-oxo-dGTP pyrophosphatase MutT (NUDIX family)